MRIWHDISFLGMYYNLDAIWLEFLITLSKDMTNFGFWIEPKHIHVASLGSDRTWDVICWLSLCSKMKPRETWIHMKRVVTNEKQSFEESYILDVP